MKYAFYFMLEAFSFLRYLHFCLDTLVMQKNGFIRKPWSSSKFITSQTGQQIITVHILSNISRSKDNQRMKFGQLIEHNIRNLFLEKLYRKYVEDTSLRPFIANQNWGYRWIKNLKYYKVCFCCMCKSRSTNIC